MELKDFLASKATASTIETLSEGTCVISKLSDLKSSQYGDGYSLAVNGGKTIFLKKQRIIGTPVNGKCTYAIKAGTNGNFMELQFENRVDTIMSQAEQRKLAVTI